jgi:hypothetical protein
VDFRTFSIDKGEGPITGRSPGDNSHLQWITGYILISDNWNLGNCLDQQQRWDGDPVERKCKSANWRT